MLLIDSAFAAVGVGTDSETEVTREELEARAEAGRRRQARLLEGEP